MKSGISKKEAEKEINEFFSRKKFRAEEVKKIKRMAMKFNLKLGEYRKKFCKKCLTQLKGKTRIKENFKSIECGNCGFKNRFKMRMR